MVKVFVFLTIFVFNILFVSSQEKECSIILQNGTVIGLLTGTLNPKKKVCAFMGIPYAQAPTGHLRFMAPQPAKSWETLHATSLPNWCPQASSSPSGVQVSEDCLYLNVYQPKNISEPDPAGLPVMIWFHGGGFTSGSSLTYTPIKLLARGDVILVVVHYRLGVLGFYSTGDAVVPGNNGLKDQAYSIRWTYENIKAFGGNPSKVTIFGESAGGASAIYQLISPLNKGLIHRVISQSGTALSSWALDRNPSESAKLIAKRLGCPTLIKTMMVNCMRKLPWQNIIKEQTDFTNESFQNFSYASAGLAPVVETNQPGAFIWEEPAVMLKYGDIPDIPILLGANKHDGSFILGTLYLAKIGTESLDRDANYLKHKIIPDILNFVNVHEDANRVVASSVELAFLNGVNRSSWNESMPGLVDVLSVFAYKSSVQHTANLLVGRNMKVFLYSMEHHSNNTLWPYFFGPDSRIPVQHGIGHADELMYIFNLPARFSPHDQAFSELICDLWLNFAKHGNPTPFTDKRYERWITYNNVDEPFFKLQLPPQMKYGYRNSWCPNGFD